MKMIMIISLLLFSATANATLYTLVSCEYRFLPEYQRSYYIGVYRSQYGNLFTDMFTSYCPATLYR